MADRTSTAESREAPFSFDLARSWAVGLWDCAASCRLSTNEAARRLAALAACNLDMNCYKSIVQLATAGVRPPTRHSDFVVACDHIRTILDTTNRTRQQLRAQTLTQAETLALIRRTADQAVRERATRQRTTTQKQTVYRTR